MKGMFLFLSPSPPIFLLSIFFFLTYLVDRIVKENVQNFSVFFHPVKTYKACISLTGHDIKNDGAVKREKKFRTVQKRKIHLGERDTDAEIRLHIFKFICQDFFTRLCFTLYEIVFCLFHTTFSVHSLILVHPYFLTHFYETCDS